MIRKRSLLSAELLDQAREWAKELTALEMQGPHDLESAWRRLEIRYGIPYATLHSLRYRKDLKDIWASLYILLQQAVEHERSRRAAQLSHRQFINDAVAEKG